MPRPAVMLTRAVAASNVAGAMLLTLTCTAFIAPAGTTNEREPAVAPVGSNTVTVTVIGPLRSAAAKNPTFVRAVAFEVDDADDVVREAALPVPPGESLPWASGVARRRGALIPILDVDALGERLA